jgi:hypothetical protein
MTWCELSDDFPTCEVMVPTGGQPMSSGNRFVCNDRTGCLMTSHEGASGSRDGNAALALSFLSNDLGNLSLVGVTNVAGNALRVHA